MYFKFGSKKVLSPIIPWYVVDGTSKDITFTLVVEADEEFNQSYLCVGAKEFVGWLTAKRATEDRYFDVGGLSDSTCYLGYFAAGEYDLNIRILPPDDTPSKLYVIPLIFVHDDGSFPPDNTTSVSLDTPSPFAVELEHAPLWNGALGGYPTFETGSICMAEHTEVVTFDSGVEDYHVCCVAIQDDMSKIYAWARNGYSPYDQVVEGIALDVENGILLKQGFVTNPSWSWTPNLQLFLADEPGQMTQTRPSLSGGVDIICGVAITDTKICFYARLPNMVYTLIDLLRDGSADASDGSSGLVYFHGGQYTGGAFTNVLEVYDANTGQLTSLTSGGPTVRDHSAVYLDGVIYVWGGVDEYGNYSDEMWSYTIATDTWDHLTDGGTGRSGAIAYVEDDKIYYVLGQNDSGVVTVVDIYDPALDSWSYDDSAPPEIDDIMGSVEGDLIGSSTSTGNTLVVAAENVKLAGGLYDNKLWYVPSVSLATPGNTRLIYYDLVLGTWTTLDTTGGPGSALFAAVSGTKLYCWSTGSSTANDNLWAFNMASNTWDHLESGGHSANRSQRGWGAGMVCFFAYNGKLYVWGGWGCSYTWPNETYGTEDYLDVYDPTTNTWSQILTDVAASRTSFASAVAGGYLYVFTGNTYFTEPDIRRIDLATGAVYAHTKPTWGGTTSGNRARRGTYYDGKFYLFDRWNYEMPLNIVDMWQTDNNYGWKSNTVPNFAATTPINYGYYCYCPTYSEGVGQTTFQPWRWDMRTQPGYYAVWGYNGYYFTFGSWDSAAVVTYQAGVGWTTGGSSGAYWGQRGTYTPTTVAAAIPRVFVREYGYNYTVLTVVTSTGGTRSYLTWVNPHIL